MLDPFRVLNPTTVAEALGELSRLGEPAKIYAGGAELLLLLRHGFIKAEYLVNIKQIADMNRLDWDGDVLHIGAAVTHHRLETDLRVREELEMLAHAESRVANIRVRNQGTLGGNVCFSDPHSDPGIVLLVYEATARTAGPNGERRLPLEDFFVSEYTTQLSDEELLLGIEVPRLPAGYGAAYLRIHRFQRPTLGVAVGTRYRNARLEGVRLAVGCAGPKPLRLRDLEAKIDGANLTDAQRIFGESAGYLRELLQPVDDLLGSADYKVYMTRVLLGRGLAQATQSNGGS